MSIYTKRLLRIPLYALLIYSIYFTWQTVTTQGEYKPQIVTSVVQEVKETLRPEPPHFSLYIVGDMMFDRAVRRQVQNKGFEYVFGNSSTTFADHDLVLGNLEGPITSSPSKTLLAGGTQSQLLIFTFPTSTADALQRLGIDVVSLANNHSQNFGAAGLRETRKLLNAHEVQYFGDPENMGEVATSTCIQKADKQLCIGFVGYHEFTYKNEEVIAEAIQTLRPQVDFLIVMPHWGNEYEPSFTQKQQKLAHQWIDLGADAVIGAHPHIITPIEIYNNKAIFYSLGNFIFDQYFSFETTHGLTLSMDITASSTTYKLMPIQNTGIHVDTPPTDVQQKILDTLVNISKKTVSTSTVDEIKQGQFSLTR